MSRRLLGTAVGLAMAQHQLSRTATFAPLRARSQNTNTRLAAVAAEVVDLAEGHAASWGGPQLGRGGVISQ